jgi:hypothetical protein
VIKSAEVFCDNEFAAEMAEKALMANGHMSTPNITLALDEASEADLLAAKSASPGQAHEVDALITFLRKSEQPSPPLRVEITNATELQKDTVLTVQRDREGKLAGATAVKV